MSDEQHPRVDMGKYFKLKQRVYLINVSENRDRERFESLSGTIVGRGGDSIAIQVCYPTDCSDQGGESFKLTTETMGNGIQVLADLVRVESGNVFHLKLCSNLEMYQRRQVPRADLNVRLLQIQGNRSLEAYRKEYQRLSEQIMNRGLPPDFRMQEATINLGAGGLRVCFEARVTPSPLSLFCIDIGDGEVPVCAMGDLVWERFEREHRMCGYRFILISKLDQQRIHSHTLALRKKRNIAAPPARSNWELLDRMGYDDGVAHR